jgi:hypothetical protein
VSEHVPNAQVARVASGQWSRNHLLHSTLFLSCSPPRSGASGSLYKLAVTPTGGSVLKGGLHKVWGRLLTAGSQGHIAPFPLFLSLPWLPGLGFKLE